MSQDVESAPGHPEVVRLIAPNPGAMTLAGTNTYLYGSNPCLAIDPGPDIASHLDGCESPLRSAAGSAPSCSRTVMAITLTGRSGSPPLAGERRSSYLATGRSTGGCGLSLLPAMRPTMFVY